MIRRIKILATTAGKPLAARICERLSIHPVDAFVERYNDGEVRVGLKSGDGGNVRGADVFVICPTHAPAENLLEAIFLAKTACGSSAGRVTLVISYLGYNRQDRKEAPRTTVSAKTVIDMLKLSGADRALLLDVHSEATLSHFESMVFDHLYASYVAVDVLKPMLVNPFVVAAPDKGAVGRASKFSQYLGGEAYIVFDKGERSAPGEVDQNKILIIGDIAGRDVLFVDDMIDTFGTMEADIRAAKRAGAGKVFVFATHGLFSRDAITRIADSDLTKLVVTDTIMHPPGFLDAAGDKIQVCSVAGLLAEAIRRIHDDQSLSSLILK